jgi:hypothetical protein
MSIGVPLDSGQFPAFFDGMCPLVGRGDAGSGRGVMAFDWRL